jgi:hypothetical protein
MATDNNSYFSNAVPGGNLIFDGNIFRLDATPKYPLGFAVQRADGSRYRYAQFGAVTNRGVLCSQDVSETSIPDTDNGIIASASAADTSWGTAGSRKIEITMAGIIANQFAGGYFSTTDDTGEGYTYRIKGNTATGTGGAVSTTYVLELFEPLVEAVGTTTDYSINGLPWNDLEVATRTTDSILSGVSMRTSTAALPFQFVQTGGVCSVLQDIHVPAIGDPVILSPLTAGSVAKYFGTGSVGLTDVAVEGANYVIGYCVDAGDSTGHTVIMLNLPW